MRNLLQELSLAARSLRRRPGFTSIAVLTLALAIGANAAIFAVVNSVLIRPLPYPASHRIVWITHNMPGLNLTNMRHAPGTLQLYDRFATSFESQSAIVRDEANLTGAGEPVRVQLLRVTPSFFDVMEVQPVLGRAPSAAEATLEAPRVAVLTYLGWRKYFGSAREAIGQTLRLNGQPVEIIGVMPRSF
ncbi:MAG TPA: ABC transporter permease, partial [Longimicrobiales bacterium]|nr:ABC transporter permease [Longimicrobiales bacterium]